MKKLTTVIASFIVLMGANANGQGAATPYVWRKLVSREIAFSAGNATAGNAAKQVKETTPALMMADAVHTGRAKAYSNLDMTLNTTVAIDETGGESLTVMTTKDPATGKPVKKMADMRPNWSAIKRYRILEEWTFDPLTCEAHVVIKGIAPVRDVYESDGSLRGVQALFWLRYKDAKKVLEEYDRGHARHAIQPLIYADNFSKQVAVTGSGQCVATFLLNMPTAGDDGKHRYKEQAPCNGMAAMLVAAKMDGVTGWSDLEFTHTLTASEVSDESAMRVDTTTIMDPITGQVERKIIRYLQGDKNKLKIAEEWTYDAEHGKTDIKPVAIAVLPEEKEAPTFWVKYADVQAMIANNDAACPDNSFALTLWKNYFTASVKPVIAK